MPDFNIGIANAQRDEAAYIYRDVVIRAYREARDAYMSVSYLNLERNSTKKQQEAAKEALAHARSSMIQGIPLTWRLLMRNAHS